MAFVKTTAVAGACLLALLAAKLTAAEPVERQVTFRGAGETKIAGTLLAPAGPAETRFPAMVLLAGSGPTDRDGNQPPSLITDLLKQCADELAKQGVASLRFDKRGMHANAKEIPQDRAQYEDYFAWENFVADSVAAYQFLSGQPEIDRGRVGFLGHSEGGVLALVAAQTIAGKDAPPAAIVLVNTPGRSLDVLIHEQLKNLLAKQNATAKETEFYLDENARITKAIRETGIVPADVPAGLKALYPAYLGKFLRSDFATDPSRAAARFSGPVLIVVGAKDAQVSPELDAGALVAAFKTRKRDDHRLLIAPDASHNLKVLKNANDAGFAGNVSPEILDAIGVWAAEKLAVGKDSAPR